MKTTYRVDGMTCNGCARSLEKALASQGVAPSACEISYQDGTLVVDGEHEPSAVTRAVEAAGFDLVAPQGG
jgi:copper chaperone